MGKGSVVPLACSPVLAGLSMRGRRLKLRESDRGFPLHPIHNDDVRGRHFDPGMDGNFPINGLD